MHTPVPKPRTKFTDAANTSDTQPDSEFPASPSLVLLDEIMKRPTTQDIHLYDDVAKQEEVKEEGVKPKMSPEPPLVPPRPPAKPPRTVVGGNNTTMMKNFGNVLGELKLNMGETQKPPDIGLILPTSNGASPANSPPIRGAPPPPRPAPPAGWRPEIIPPPIPERATSHNRPLPSIPFDACQPSSSTEHVAPQVVENPMYLSLDAYRTVSGITPSPKSATESECEKVREWLTEEEEAEIECASTSRPMNLNTSIEPIPSTSGSHETIENPYTPCPRRSDFSSTEYLGSTADPFNDDFFNNSTRNSSFSSKQQNRYISHREMFGTAMDRKSVKSTSSEYKDVVEACSPEPPSYNRNYVNISEITASPSNSSIVKEEMNGALKIDGSSVTFLGFVTLTTLKKGKRAHCRLRNMQLSFHEDDESDKYSYGPYDIKDIYMFRKSGKDSSITEVATTSVSTSTSSTVIIHIGEKKQIVSFIPDEPANLWMFFISEAWLSLHCGLTAVLKDAEELMVCGNVWIKHCSTGEWVHCSAGISNMNLYYVLAEPRDRILRGSNDEIVEVDLRKVMTIREKIDNTEFCPNVKHKRGPFSITMNGVALYIDSRDDSTTTNWFETVDEVLKRPATKLEQFRLTAEGLPVIVDKCIRFVSSYGLKSEGIYRRNGKVSEAKIILSKLMEDPVGYHLVEDNSETVYAVADVLRQFFRKLEEPLIPKAIQPDLFELATETQSTELWQQYSEVVKSLPKVHQATLKKLIGHLKNVTDHSDENRASVENLAKVFGASLFLTDSDDEKVFSETYNEQINAMIHLITGYDSIFQISFAEEVSRQMVDEAERKRVAPKYGADFIVPIHIWEKENRPFNVKIGFACEEVIREAVASRHFDGPSAQPYAVFEMLCEGKLIRRIPPSEKMSVSMMRWLDWGINNGYLLFDHDKNCYDGKDFSNFTGKLKVAEPTSKSFKSYEFKIDAGTYIRGFRNEKLWKSWKIDEVVWFIGAEPNRKAPNQFNATMLPTSKDGHPSRFPGYCFSFKDEKERSRWMSAITIAQTGGMTEKLVHI